MIKQQSSSEEKVLIFKNITFIVIKFVLGWLPKTFCGFSCIIEPNSFNYFYLIALLRHKNVICKPQVLIKMENNQLPQNFPPVLITN